MKIREARQFIIDNKPQIERDFHQAVREAFSLVLNAKWGDDGDVIAAVTAYQKYHYRDGGVILPAESEA